MLDESFVIDGVAHAYNFDISNNVLPASTELFAEMTYKQHLLYSPRDPGRYLQTKDEFLQSCKPEWVAHALFSESPVDMAVYHAVPLYDFFKDGLSSLEKGVEMKQRWPDRVLLYGTCNPLEGRVALEKIDEQLSSFNIDGVKLYPAVYYAGRSIGWRMDDRDVAYPLFEHMLELGITNVAVHKAIPLGPSDVDTFHVDDIVPAARQFPELNFQIVHGGIAFLEETMMLIRRFPNVYLNLESTVSYAASRPRVFAEILGSALYYGSAEQLIFATGCNLVHPRPILQALWDFEMPQDLIDGYGYSPVTLETKQKIVGLNLARLHGIDVERATKAIADDEFSNLESVGFSHPWGRLRGEY